MDTQIIIQGDCLEEMSMKPSPEQLKKAEEIYSQAQQDTDDFQDGFEQGIVPAIAQALADREARIREECVAAVEKFLETSDLYSFPCPVIRVQGIGRFDGNLYEGGAENVIEAIRKGGNDK